ncbi:hypothetical protein K1719_004084 [Acacia pycnantha]|nr:hypothetical protein K1719_004084 [Acacia pycnantha]
MRKGKPKGSRVNSSTTYWWETVATNFDEFVDVTKKERLLKKQQREALLLDTFLVVDGIGPGRSLRGRKPVTYTFGKSKKA